jgi:hypothetical protein
MLHPRRHIMNLRSVSRALRPTALLVAFGLGPAVLGVTPAAGQELSLFRVRAGSQVLACGGFSGACQTYELHGTIRMDVKSQAPEDPDPPFFEIDETELFLDLGAGTNVPFPGFDDLPLAGLRGDWMGGTAMLEAQNEHGQSVALRVVEINAPPAEHAFAIQGTYDEGCCDRFVFDLGNVVLDRVPDEDGVLLDGNATDRLAVRVQWRASEGDASMDAVPQRTGTNAAQFWFFGPENPEIFVKVVPACTDALEHQLWVFVSGLTDLGVTVRITDRFSGQEVVYDSEAGEPFVTITDTRAFPCVLSVE